MSGRSDKAFPSKPVVGVSSCLLGNEVRYDGRHKFNRIVAEDLSRYFELEPYCPEVAIGMGVPRPPIRLTVENGVIRALGVENVGLDMTTALQTYGGEIAGQAGHLSGFIFKKGSPSCGISGVPLFDQAGLQIGEGSGLFAAKIVTAVPKLPVVDEARLEDPCVRKTFIARVEAFSQQRR